MGGKWTSFRAFSEEVTDKTLGALRRTRKSSTRNLAIGGGRDYPVNQQAYESWLTMVTAQSSLTRKRAGELFIRYGTRAKEFANYISQGDDSPLKNLPGYTRREIEFIVNSEKVVHLDDLLLRRSMLAKLGQITAENLEEVAEIIAAALNWGDEGRENELNRAGRILAEKHGVRL